MSVLFRIFLLGFVLIVSACVSRDDARQQAGLGANPDPTSKIPAEKWRPGYEKVHQRPDATPTPVPTNPMDRPLDPAGLPTGD